ncbi:hypothetical protein K0M31_016143 [Melipona bicolor]|uniref:Uncharacterized protein n=1 Tax=Melipona bicolor TaxID=60889 RepID=A0AA40G6G8_9HYME|nr:hypothetical protein K0M31_016143 [Melipona bicolor]
MISGVGATTSRDRIKGKVQVQIASRCTNYKYDLSCLVMRKLTTEIPNFMLASTTLPIPSHLVLADPQYYVSRDVDLIIGNVPLRLDVCRTAPWVPGATLSRTHTLEPSEKRLHKLGAQRFIGLFVLNRLTLSGNAIANLDSLAFRDCSNLKELHLSGNELTTVPDAPRDLALLKTLDHGENRSSLYNSLFRNLDPLTGS